MAEEDVEQFAKWPPMTWTVGGTTHKVPVVTLKRIFGNRLAKHVRPYRKGARHDNTGPDPVGWEVSTVSGKDVARFYPWIPEDYYPNGIKALELSFELEETGTLVTPYGEKRCKASSGSTIWDRRGEAGVDGQATSLIWVEDNEDDTDLAAFEPPQARVAGPGQVDAFLGFAAQVGAGAGDFFDSLKEAMRDLKALADYPGETVAQMVTRVSIITGAVKSTYEAYASAPAGVANTLGALLNDPLAGPALRKLEQIVDSACKAAEDEARRNGARVLKYYDRTVSIFDVAVDVSQSAKELMAINPTLDPYEIKARTPIQVFA
jgi:hypothetical protein